MNFPRLAPAQLWPQFVMLRANDFLPKCKFSAFRAAAVAACDPLDGVVDGVIGDVAGCRFDPRTLVGARTPCGVITRSDATVMEEIWQGPRTAEGTGRGRRLWYGLEPGSDVSYLATTVPDGDRLTGYPFFIASSWFTNWLARNPSFDWTSLTTSAYVELFRRGVEEYPSLESDDPDLSRFQASGGKLVIWAGLADPFIPPQDSIRYYDDVVQRAGGEKAADGFARLFLAPGVGHCGATGTVGGPVPVDPLVAVTSWVESGRAPASIAAARTDSTGRVVQTRPVCRYPLVARYRGTGSTDAAQNFSCARSFG